MHADTSHMRDRIFDLAPASSSHMAQTARREAHPRRRGLGGAPACKTRAVSESHVGRRDLAIRSIDQRRHARSAVGRVGWRFTHGLVVAGEVRGLAEEALTNVVALLVLLLLSSVHAQRTSSVQALQRGQTDCVCDRAFCARTPKMLSLTSPGLITLTDPKRPDCLTTTGSPV